MSKQKKFTISVSRGVNDSVSRYRVSRAFFLVTGIVLVAFFSFFTLSMLHYYHMWKDFDDYALLKNKFTQLSKENEAFRLVARQLNEKVSSLEVSSKKLEMISGLTGEGLGGVGGPSPFVPSELDSQSLSKHFRSLERRSISLGASLRQLQGLYNTRIILLASTPAIMPVQGYPSGNFGYRKDPFNGEREFHPGIDISSPRGNKVMATADGVVAFAGRKIGYGKLIKIKHRFGISTLYGHLGSITVKHGQSIRKGDLIGYVGSTGRTTGPHLHYEVRLNSQPLNPLRFFRDSGS